MAIALVQSRKFIGAGSGTSFNPAFTSTVTAGNLLIMSMDGFNSGTVNINTPTDTKGHTWLPLPATEIEFGAGQNAGRTFYVANCQGGANTITSTWSASVTNPVYILSEWSGISASPLDKNIAAALGTGTAVSTGASGVLAQADELVYAYALRGGGGVATWTEDTADGFTLLQEEEDDDTNNASAAQYKIVSATTSLTANWVLGVSNNWGCHICSFEAASEAPPATPPSLWIPSSPRRW